MKLYNIEYQLKDSAVTGSSVVSAENSYQATKVLESSGKFNGSRNYDILKIVEINLENQQAGIISENTIKLTEPLVITKEVVKEIIKEVPIETKKNDNKVLYVNHIGSVNRLNPLNGYTVFCTVNCALPRNSKENIYKAMTLYTFKGGKYELTPVPLGTLTIESPYKIFLWRNFSDVNTWENMPTNLAGAFIKSKSSTYIKTGWFFVSRHGKFVLGIPGDFSKLEAKEKLRLKFPSGSVIHSKNPEAIYKLVKCTYKVRGRMKPRVNWIKDRPHNSPIKWDISLALNGYNIILQLDYFYYRKK